MAGVLNYSEEQRFWNRIRCITYREIWDEMIARTEDSLITHQWISVNEWYDGSLIDSILCNS